MMPRTGDDTRGQIPHRPKPSVVHSLAHGRWPRPQRGRPWNLLVEEYGATNVFDDGIGIMNAEPYSVRALV